MLAGVSGVGPVTLSRLVGRLGTAGAVLNAANEEAVQGFLDGRLRFTDIAEVCAGVLAAHPYRSDPELDELRALDTWARQEVASWASV